MTDDILTPAQVVIDGCDPECPCQLVHVLFENAEGEVFAGGGFCPDQARALAKDLEKRADIAEARQRRIEGRLA